MFMQIAIGAIGIGVVLMVGFIVIAQVRTALPSASTIGVINACAGLIGTDQGVTGACRNLTDGGDGYNYYAPDTCGSTNLTDFNTTAIVSCPNIGYNTGTAAVQVTVFAGFGLVAVGIIVLAAFGLINVFK